MEQQEKLAGDICLQDNSEQRWAVSRGCWWTWFHSAGCSPEAIAPCYICAGHDASTTQPVVSNWLHQVGSQHRKQEKKKHVYFIICQCLLLAFFLLPLHFVAMDVGSDPTELFPCTVFKIFFKSLRFPASFQSLLKASSILGISVHPDICGSLQHGSILATAELPAVCANFFWLGGQ